MAPRRRRTPAQQEAARLAREARRERRAAYALQVQRCKRPARPAHTEAARRNARHPTRPSPCQGRATASTAGSGACSTARTGGTATTGTSADGSRWTRTARSRSRCSARSGSRLCDAVCRRPRAARPRSSCCPRACPAPSRSCTTTRATQWWPSRAAQSGSRSRPRTHPSILVARRRVGGRFHRPGVQRLAGGRLVEDGPGRRVAPGARLLIIAGRRSLEKASHARRGTHGAARHTCEGRLARRARRRATRPHAPAGRAKRHALCTIDRESRVNHTARRAGACRGPPPARPPAAYARRPAGRRRASPGSPRRLRLSVSPP